jgi:hypothetical protein
LIVIGHLVDHELVVIGIEEGHVEDWVGDGVEDHSWAGLLYNGLPCRGLGVRNRDDDFGLVHRGRVHEGGTLRTGDWLS